MAIPGHDFLTAHFSNNERTTVESYWVTPDGLETRVEYIEANPEDTAWKKLLTHIDIDSLHENTYQHIKTQNNIFKDDVVKIAKERGLIHDLSNLNDVDNMNLVVQFIFGEFNEEKDKEKLFMFKLKLFEVTKIKTSKNRAMKAKMRKAENILDVIKAAIEILEE
jgi:hypothetical protein